MNFTCLALRYITFHLLLISDHYKNENSKKGMDNKKVYDAKEKKYNRKYKSGNTIQKRVKYVV